jgi:diamine N-acetyltransferase
VAEPAYKIKSLSTETELAQSVPIIRESFRTVAVDFGLTETNCPTHPSFMTSRKLVEESGKGLLCFGLFEGDVQVGFVGATRASDDLFYLQRLAVLPARRHHGYGRALVDHVFSYAKRSGGRRISIAIIDESRVLKRWYSEYGFRETDRKVFPHLPFTVCFMEKETA